MICFGVTMVPAWTDLISAISRTTALTARTKCSNAVRYYYFPHPHYLIPRETTYPVSKFFLLTLNLDSKGMIHIIGQSKNFADKIPEHARCNFQNGWCGWKNVSGRPLSWILNSGPTPSERTGPSFDHTYRNETGICYRIKIERREATRNAKR